jgi:hypothetical protein
MSDDITTEMGNVIFADATNEEIDISRQRRAIIRDEIEEIERNIDRNELRKERLKMMEEWRMEDGGCYQGDELGDFEMEEAEIRTLTLNWERGSDWEVMMMRMKSVCRRVRGAWKHRARRGKGEWFYGEDIKY